MFMITPALPAASHSNARTAVALPSSVCSRQTNPGAASASGVDRVERRHEAGELRAVQRRAQPADVDLGEYELHEGHPASARRARSRWPRRGGSDGAGSARGCSADCSKGRRRQWQHGIVRAALIEQPGTVTVREVPAPAVDGRALVRVAQAGLCGTDVKIASGADPGAHAPGAGARDDRHGGGARARGGSFPRAPRCWSTRPCSAGTATCAAGTGRSCAAAARCSAATWTAASRSWWRWTRPACIRSPPGCPRPTPACCRCCPPACTRSPGCRRRRERGGGRPGRQRPAAPSAAAASAGWAR